MAKHSRLMRLEYDLPPAGRRLVTCIFISILFFYFIICLLMFLYFCVPKSNIDKLKKMTLLIYIVGCVAIFLPTGKYLMFLLDAR